MLVNIETMKYKKNGVRNHAPDSIQYAGFHARSIAAVIDCTLIAIAFLPLFFIINNIIFGNVLPNDVLNNASQEMMELTKSGKNIGFMEFINTNAELKKYFITDHGLIKAIINQFIQLFSIAAVFLYFWFKKQATPGKMFLSLKIVDAKTLAKPSKKQLIIRMISYIISVLPLALGIIWISFDSKKQGWHDKIANTLVIKELKKGK